jgi:23S rRNA (adenine-N6)-dimethyltransferase
VAGQSASRAARRHSLGQHFLESESLVGRLVADAHIAADERVVDLGAGSGRLTDALARKAAHVLAVELDPLLVAQLGRRFAATPNVSVHLADALEFPLPATPFRVFANAPWNRTADLLHRLLDNPSSALTRADLVLQWQVARARAEGDDLLGEIWAPWWEFRRGRRIPAAFFRPTPHVDAAVLTITRRLPPRLPPGEFATHEARVRRRGTRP